MFEVRFKKYWLALPFGNPDMEYDPDIEGNRAFTRASFGFDDNERLAIIAAANAARGCSVLKFAQSAADMYNDLSFEAQFKNIWSRWSDWLMDAIEKEGRDCSREESYRLMARMAKYIIVEPHEHFGRQERVDVEHIRQLSEQELQAASEQLRRVHVDVDYTEAA